MRYIFTLLLSTLMAVSALAQESSKQEIVKTGYNFGPLPAVAFDADKGFQLGALLNIYDFGDGSTYPNTRQQWYFEASFFTKGSQLFVVSYDNRFLIPGVRWSSTFTLTNDKAMDFYGFNGYMSYYDHAQVAAGKDKANHNDYIYTPKYRVNRLAMLFKSDFTGNIWQNKLFWEAGYHLSYIKQGYKDEQALNLEKINKNKEDYKMFPANETPVFDLYRRWGIISEDEAWGGWNSTVRLGLLFDTRDKEGAPSRGVWAEAHATLAPKWLGTTNPYYRYSMTFRHYLPIVKNDILTFAYRLNYEGTIGKTAPYYVLPFITVMGPSYDRDGMGGYRTIRGLMRNRVQGLDVASYNAELRWRFVNFALWNQNIAFGLSAFSDGTMVTRNYDMSFKGEEQHRAEYDEYMARTGNRTSDRPHITVGAGLRFIMNQNFIVAFEYGLPVSKFSKDELIKNQDGDGAFYINTGFLF
ncbi:MAG: BamA/TamA family outer membrane protein [Alistipes sp.]|nr:BamA/TamA family outer membrane protein [Alistipes sp.]MBQ5618676.1 BamA/TamA family outer membrane protein [Alistipes sp.]MBQ5923503.1 BamA/TamA family outer membrane protein [Alistipes sp.]